MYRGDDEDKSAEDLAGDRSSDSGVDLTGDFVGVLTGVSSCEFLETSEEIRESALQHCG